ncbi:MAG TPA: threonine synthase, partial [Chitinophagaceae bacterium]|nr:threonine synthase [Chitinophagaceae bacterium]
MKYYSIQNKEEWVNLREAVVKSMSSQSGLYMPEQIPVLPASFFRELPGMKLPEIAFRVSQVLLGDDIPLKDLERMAYTALDFDIPLKALDQQVSVLELFHGPTLAFKDVGARYMAALFEYVLEKSDEEVTILAATSGDTGSAVADAFYNKKGVKVCILYPSGKVSALQEKQLTTMGGNITTYEVDGSFDECQRLVKMAFADEELNKKRNLTSANSINLARLLPQSFYYFYACAQRAEYNQPVWISVPSGNFGNLCAGLIAWKMGLPVQRFIAATNSNHVVPDYLKSGEFTPEEIKYTLSNAMDVALPSNFPRIKELFQQSWPA